MRFSLGDIAKYTSKPIFSGIPPTKTFFMIHPTECYSNATVMYRPGEKKWYLVGSKLKEKDNLIGGSGANLYWGQDNRGQDWIVIATLAQDGQVVEAVERARKVWMERLDGMKFQEHPEIQARPIWRDDQSFESLLNLAFQGRFINSGDHSVFSVGGDVF